MKFVDRWSDTLTNFLVPTKHICNYEPIEGISKDISELKRLKQEIETKNVEITRKSVEWDRTFDSISDSIVIVDVDYNINRCNDAFMKCVEPEGISYEELIEMNWVDFYKEVLGFPDDKCIVTKCIDTHEPQKSMIEHHNRSYDVQTTPIFDESGDFVGCVRVSRDVTEVEFQKKVLNRRTSLFAAISNMSKILTNHSDWRDALKEILSELGGAVGAHRVYIFENEEKKERVCSNIVSVWLNPMSRICDVASDINDCINYDLCPELKESMMTGESVQTTLPRCGICPEREHCICSEDVIVLGVPIFSDSKWWGFIGFDYYNGHKKFKDRDEVILKIAADIIGGVIHHRKKYYDEVDKDYNT